MTSEGSKNEGSSGVNSQEEDTPKSTEEKLKEVDASIARMKQRKRTIIKKSKEAITKADTKAKILTGVALFSAIVDKTIDQNTAKRILEKLQKEDLQAIIRAVENDKSTIKENVRKKVLELLRPESEEDEQAESSHNEESPSEPPENATKKHSEPDNTHSSPQTQKPIPTTELSRGSRKEKRGSVNKPRL